VFRVFHCLTVEVLKSAAWGVSILPDISKEDKTSFSYSSFKSIHGLIAREIRAACSFETSGSNYPTTLCVNPEGLLPQ